jgi:hypothetical protein
MTQLEPGADRRRSTTFYFTEIGYPQGGPNPVAPLTLNTVNEVAVWNTNGIADYKFDTSLGDTCFGDQPKTGFDTNALLMSTDEFCGPGGNNFEGALAMVISKSQLVAEAPVVTDAILGHRVHSAGSAPGSDRQLGNLRVPGEPVLLRVLGIT